MPTTKAALAERITDLTVGEALVDEHVIALDYEYSEQLARTWAALDHLSAPLEAYDRLNTAFNANKGTEK